MQIKTNHAASQICFRGKADLLLVLRVETDGAWSEVYYGPFETVKAASRYSGPNNKQMIAVTKLRALMKPIPTAGPQEAARIVQQIPDIPAPAATLVDQAGHSAGK